MSIYIVEVNQKKGKEKKEKKKEKKKGKKKEKNAVGTTLPLCSFNKQFTLPERGIPGILRVVPSNLFALFILQYSSRYSLPLFFLLDTL